MSNAQTTFSSDQMLPCPSCKREIPAFRGHPTWCKNCDWNLYGGAQTRKKTRLEMVRSRIGHRVSLKLFEEIEQRRIENPRLTIWKVAVWAVSSMIYLSVIGFLAAGVYLISFWPAPVFVFFGIILCVISSMAIPKRRKENPNWVSRSTAPNLFELCDRIADEMKTTHIEYLAIDELFNASYLEIGWARKKKQITLGVPLAESLDDQQLVALLAHETAHGANGDLMRTRYVSVALQTLVNWHRTIAPYSIFEGDFRTPFGVLAIVPANLIRFALSLIPYSAYYLLHSLAMKESQEAEYLADRLGAKVAGTEAMSRMLYNVDASYFSFCVQKVAVSPEGEGLFARLKKSEPVPEHERLRRDRIESYWGLSLDSSHPPTAYRRRALLARPVPASLRLNPDFMLAVRVELAGFHDEVSRRVVENYRRQIS